MDERQEKFWIQGMLREGWFQGNVRDMDCRLLELNYLKSWGTTGNMQDFREKIDLEVTKCEVVVFYNRDIDGNVVVLRMVSVCTQRWAIGNCEK